MKNNDSEWSLKRQNSVILIFIVFAAVLRFICLADKSVVGDESCTLDLIKLSWTQILYNQYSGEFNPALYFLILKLWSGLFGTHELAVRSLSVLFSTLTLPFIFLAGRQAISFRAGLLAAWFYVLSPLAIQYAQISRAYSLLLLCSAASLYFFLQFLASPKPSVKNLSILLVVNLIGSYTHYFAILFWIMEGIALIVFALCKQWRSHFKYFLLGSLIGLVAYIPQLTFLFHQASDVAKIEQKQASLGFAIKLGLMIYGLFIGESLSPLNLIYVSLAFISLIIISTWGFISLSKKHSPILFLLLLLALPPVLAISFTGIARPMYVIFVLPPLLIILAAFLLQVRPTFLRVLLLTFLSLVSLRADAYWYQKNPQQVLNSGLLVPMREIAQSIQQQEKMNDGILLFPEWLHFSFNYYYSGLVPPSSISRKNYADEIQKLPSSLQRLWVVAEYDDGNRREELKKLLGEKWELNSSSSFVPNEHLIDRIKGKQSETYHSIELLFYKKK